MLYHAAARLRDDTGHTPAHGSTWSTATPPLAEHKLQGLWPATGSTARDSPPAARRRETGSRPGCGRGPPGAETAAGGRGPGAGAPRRRPRAKRAGEAARGAGHARGGRKPVPLRAGCCRGAGPGAARCGLRAAGRRHELRPGAPLKGTARRAGRAQAAGRA